MIAHGQCSGAALADTATLDGFDNTHGDSGHQRESQNNDKQGGVKIQFLGFGLLLDLTLGQLGNMVGMAKLLLSGCAHVIISSLE